MLWNGQRHFKNLAAFAARFLKCVWPCWPEMLSRNVDQIIFILFGKCLFTFSVTPSVCWEIFRFFFVVNHLPQKRIQKFVKHLRWSFMQKASSQILDRVLNTLVRNDLNLIIWVSLMIKIQNLNFITNVFEELNDFLILTDSVDIYYIYLKKQQT